MPIRSAPSSSALWAKWKRSNKKQPHGAVFYYSLRMLAGGCIDGQNDHQAAKGIPGISNVQYIGIGQTEKLSGCPHDNIAVAIGNGIVPIKEVAIHRPAFTVQFEPLEKQGVKDMFMKKHVTQL